MSKLIQVHRKCGYPISSKGLNNEEIVASIQSLCGIRMMKLFFLFLTIVLSAIELKAQEESKFIADSINGIYIPINLEDCFKQIDLFWNDSTKQKVANWTEEEFSGKAHMGFGLWMRNNWRLWSGSRLSKYFNDLEIYHPDDMSGIILTSYHRRMNGKKIDLERQIEYYKAYWEQVKIEDQESQKIEFSEFIVGDTIDFTYDFGFISDEQEKFYMNESCIAYGIILDKNESDYLLFIKLIKACDEKGIIVGKYDKYDPDSNKIIEKDVAEIMLKENEKWLSYDSWTTRYF